ncbi:hypothetical protein [Pendulispora albinea]|uniref:Uncharacterized protein n=1 Tax=Pendulispora albinea TaxID=2741071 RepID=A0ABZ2LX48_9BACT
MRRLVPDLDLVGLPSGISRAQQSHHAAGLGELVELMTSILLIAVMRETGYLPTLRNATSERISVICAGPAPLAVLPTSLRLEERFVRRMLTVWDGHTTRVARDASTYLLITPDEYVVGIAPRYLLDAITSKDSDATQRGLDAAERVLAIRHA